MIAPYALAEEYQDWEFARPVMNRPVSHAWDRQLQVLGIAPCAAFRPGPWWSPINPTGIADGHHAVRLAWSRTRPDHLCFCQQGHPPCARVPQMERHESPRWNGRKRKSAATASPAKPNGLCPQGRRKQGRGWGGSFPRAGWPEALAAIPRTALDGLGGDACAQSSDTARSSRSTFRSRNSVPVLTCSTGSTQPLRDITLSTKMLQTRHLPALCQSTVGEADLPPPAVFFGQGARTGMRTPDATRGHPGAGRCRRRPTVKHGARPAASPCLRP